METYTSFAEMGKAMGVRRKPKDESVSSRKCFKCGGDMALIPGTNVYVCQENEHESDDERDQIHYALKKFR